MAPPPKFPLPRVKIVEQPVFRGRKLRYKSEKRSGSSIIGENSTQDRTTYPKIKIEYLARGKATVFILCVSKDEPCRLHPHELVGKWCKDGVYKNAFDITETANECEFVELSVRSLSPTERVVCLNERLTILRDPFKNGSQYIDKWKPEDATWIDWRKNELSGFRLAFLVVVDYDCLNKNKWLETVVSHTILTKNVIALRAPVIQGHFGGSGSIRGGERLCLIGAMGKRNHTKVVFYETDQFGTVRWQEYAEIVDMRKEVVIVCLAPRYDPPYFDPQSHIGQINVNIKLIDIPSGQSSKSVAFEYHNEGANKKRKVINPSLLHYDVEESIPRHVCLSPYLSNAQGMNPTHTGRDGTVTPVQESHLNAAAGPSSMLGLPYSETQGTKRIAHSLDQSNTWGAPMAYDSSRLQFPHDTFPPFNVPTTAYGLTADPHLSQFLGAEQQSNQSNSRRSTAVEREGNLPFQDSDSDLTSMFSNLFQK